ncbi:MAG: OmpA family protein [Bacteroidia bacterium]
MKTLLSLCLLIITPYFSFSQITKTVSVHFEVDKHYLQEEAVKTLDQLLEEVKYFHIDKIELTAHTDHDASESYNLALSKRRASSVGQYLTSNGLSQQHLLSSWHGEYIPIASNLTDDGKQQNRRVDLTITYHPYNDVDEVLEDLKQDVQKFKLNPTGPTTIIGEEGIEVEIPDNSFIDENGNPVSNSEVVIELEEFTSIGESFTNQLSTESNGEMLETGGMLRIDAFQGNNRLRLNKKKEIKIKIPNPRILEGMTVFTGQRGTDGVMNWNNTGTSFGQKEILTEGSPLVIDTMAFYEFVDYNLDHRRNYLKELEISYPDKPVRPSTPAKPRAPRRPDPEQVYTGLAKWLSSDERKNRKADEEYNKLMERYDTRMERYERNSAAYKNKLELHNKAMLAYKTEISAINERLEFHIEFLTERYNELKSVYDQKRLNFAIFKFSALSKTQQLKSGNPTALLRRYATIPIKDEMYQDLKQIGYFLSYYKFLAQFDPEYINKYFVYKGQLRVHRMRKKGFSVYNQQQFFALNNQNVKLDAMLTGTEVPSIIAEAVSQKMEVDRASGITALSEFDQAYNASTSQLGWINCDRFSKIRRNRMINVSMMSAIGARMMIYVKRFRSLMNANAGTARVPKNTTIKAIFMTTIDGKPHISIDELKPKDNVGIKPDYEPVTLEEIKERLAKL